MFANFEEKGKIFTQVVTKVPVQVIIQTTQQLVRGEFYIRPDERFKDALDNQKQPFVAITNAVILDAQQQELYRCKFMTINQNEIVWIIPEADVMPKGGSEAGQS